MSGVPCSGAGVITVLKQWLQDWLPKLLGASGNFEMIVFGVMMILSCSGRGMGFGRFWPAGSQRASKPERARWPLPCREKPLPESGQVLLEARNVVKALWWPGGQQQHESHVRAGEIMALIGPMVPASRPCSTAFPGSIGQPRARFCFVVGPVTGLDSREIAKLG
jgi:hypothetical protein